MAHLDFSFCRRKVQHLDVTVDAASFENFEKAIFPVVERRAPIFEALPGIEHWGDIPPSREKLFEYHLTHELLPEKLDGFTILDVASCTSVYPQYLAETTPAKVIRQDLYYTPGVTHAKFPRVLGGDTTLEMDVLGGDACDIPLEPESLDLITLHCSLEHFAGDADTRFMRAAMRLLRPGGRILVIPFYCGPQLEEHYKDGHAPGSEFHRYYSPPAFRERVLDHIDVPYRLEIRYYTNHKEIDESFYCAYSISLIRTARWSVGSLLGRLRRKLLERKAA